MPILAKEQMFRNSNASGSWKLPCEPAPLESFLCAGKFPSIPQLHAMESCGFLPGFSMSFSLGFQCPVRWVLIMLLAGF